MSMRLCWCVIVCALTDPLREEQSQDHTSPDLWPHQEWPIMPRQGQRARGTQTLVSDCRLYHDWFTYCSNQEPCYRPFSSVEQTRVLIRRMTNMDALQEVKVGEISVGFEKGIKELGATKLMQRWCYHTLKAICNHFMFWRIGMILFVRLVYGWC